MRATTTLLALLLGSLQAVANLVPDASFETEAATVTEGASWIDSGRTGSHAVRVERKTERETPQVSLPPVSAKAGRYLLSGWMRGRVTRGADRNFSVELNAVWLDADGREAGRSRGPSASGSLPVWDYREGIVKAPEGTAAVRLEFGFTGAVVGYCELDDVCLTPAAAERAVQDLPTVDCRPTGSILALGETYALNVTLPAQLGRARKVVCRATVRDSLDQTVGTGEATGEIPATWRTITEVPIPIPRAGNVSGEWLAATVAVVDAESGEPVARGECGMLILPRPTDFERKPDSPFGVLVGHPYTKRWLGARWDRPNLCNERLLEVAKRYGVSRMPLMTVPHERIDEPGVAEEFRQKVTDYVRENALYLDYLQVGNEPPLFRPGVTERYVKTLQIAYEAAKAVKPSIQISTAGITGLDIDEEMIARMLDAGAAKYCDMIDIHTYLSLPEMDRIIAKVRRQMAERGVEKPLILSEVTAHLGSPIPERDKASRVYQRHAIALGHDIRQIYWFVLHWVNAAPGGFRHCGLIDSANHAPWPAAAAYARMTSVLEGRQFHSRLGADIPGTWVFTFHGDGKTGVIAWSDQPGTFVTVSGSDAVTIYDVFGRTLTEQGSKTYSLELTDEPLLIDAGEGRVAVGMRPPTVSSAIARGGSVRLSFDGFAETPARRCIVGLSAEDLQKDGLSLRAAPDAPLGKTEAWFTGSSPDGTWQLRRARLTITDPLELTVQPAFVAGKPAFRATILNRSAQLVSGAVTVTSPFTRGLRPEALQATFADLPGGQSRELTLPVSGLCDPQHSAEVEAVATTSGGAQASWTRRVSFLAATPWQGQWGEERPIRIGPLGAARRDAPESNPDVPGDLSAVGSVAWDATFLHLLVVVTDDTHRNERQDGSLWDGDSIQLGIATDPGREGVEHAEISVGLGKAGPQAWIHQNFAGRPTGPANFPADVRRQGTTTTYDIAIPWKTLGVSPKPGDWLGIGLVVNEDDAGKRGWLGWHRGIATDKNPALYGQIVLTK
jgi:hypothetical protein